MANSSDNKKVPSSTPSKGNKGNLKSDLVTMAAFGAALGLPIRDAVALAVKLAPKVRRTTESGRAEDDPRLVREAFGKRRHKRGWCSL